MATTEEHCTGCENACPINALSCAKGRALHGIAETATKETLVRKLIRCGARAGQIADDLDSWGLEEDMVINGLNSEQQTQLSDALDKTNYGRRISGKSENKELFVSIAREKMKK